MKPTKLLIFVFSLAIFITFGCSGDGPTNSDKQAPEAPSAEDFSKLRESARSSKMQTAQFNAEDGLSFTSDKGVDLDIPANCVSLDGNAVNGSVELEYMELFDRSNMLTTNRPTMGVMKNGDKKMLVSGGAFLINAYQNDKKLEATCHNIRLVVPTDLTGGTDEDMILWKGTVDEKDNLSWEKKPTNATGVAGHGLGIKGNSYYAMIGDFGYTNVDRFISDSGPKTTLKVTVPNGYNFDNSSVYLTYDGEDHSLANLDTFDEEGGYFTEHYGQVPIGLDMHVIFMTEKDGQWRYAIKGVTVAEGDQYDFSLSETTLGSEQDLVDAIAALP